MDAVNLAVNKMLSDTNPVISFESVMDAVNGVLWGPIMIVLLVGTGVYLTVRLRFSAISHFFIRLIPSRRSRRACGGRMDVFLAFGSFLEVGEYSNVV